MISDSLPLRDLRQQFLATSTTAMPIAGTIFWGAAMALSFVVTPRLLAFIVLMGSGMIFPLAILIDKLRGRNLLGTGTANPVLRLFMLGIVMVALLWPLVIIAAKGNPTIIVLGGAILMGIVWIPYGWAADDPVGLRHAIGRAVGSYVAYLTCPQPYAAAAICLIVLLSYAYSFVAMKRPPVPA